MRPNIEYGLRTGYLQSLFKIPFSLFLESIWDETIYSVLSVNRTPEINDSLTVKHWNITNVNRKVKLPPCQETTIAEKDLFSSEHTILKDYRPIQYFFNDYEYNPEPEGVETELWVAEEQKKYKSSLNNFYFNVNHQTRRETILWHTFVKGFLNESFLELHSLPLVSQQIIVKDMNKSRWQNWRHWKKYILNFNSVVAPEIIFNQAYQEKVKRNNDFQHFHLTISSPV